MENEMRTQLGKVKALFGEIEISMKNVGNNRFEVRTIVHVLESEETIVHDMLVPYFPRITSLNMFFMRMSVKLAVGSILKSYGEGEVEAWTGRLKGLMEHANEKYDVKFEIKETTKKRVEKVRSTPSSKTG